MLRNVGRESVVDIVVEQIKDLILDEIIKPGDKIPTEVELMEQLGVGRNSVREATKMLTALGVLEVKRGQGTFVATKVEPTFFDPFIFSLLIEPKSNQDLYELRVMYDSMVAFTVLNNGTDEEFRALEENIDTVEAEFLAGKHIDNIDYFVEMDLAFHRILLKATHNPLIIRMGEAILGLFPRYIKKSISQENGVQRAILNHRQILKTLKERDVQHIVMSIEETLEEWKRNWGGEEESTL